MALASGLAQLGWQQFFQQQLSLEEWETLIPARIFEQHASIVAINDGSEEFNLTLSKNMPQLVVGDWVLLDEGRKFVRLLDRKTCFSRKAPGNKLKQQLISANVDSAFIVSSMNEDFNLNRIERFLALANEAGAEPVVILSKSDQVANSGEYLTQVQELDALLSVRALDCRSPQCSELLEPWLTAGNTVVVLGSSGVGKSTLVNTLLAESRQNTQGIREDDSKGRHTTTRRSLIALACGALMLDTPGMREIQLADASEGIANTFSDILQYAQRCRFGDCQHQSEPGCAVQKAVEAGELEARRLNNYLKLLREEALNTASLSEKRGKEKALSKFYKRSQSEAQTLKGR